MTDRESLLQELYNLRAVTLDQSARLWFDGNRDETYEAVDKLKKDELVVTRRLPKDNRVRYVCARPLAVDGYMLDTDDRKYVLPDFKLGPKLVAANELYVRAVEAGIPRTVLVPRHQCYARFKLPDVGLPLRWLLELGEKRYAVYSSKDTRYPRGFNKQVAHIPGGTFTGHLAFHANPANIRRETHRFLKDCPSVNFHVLTYEDMPAVKGLLLSPDAWLETLRKRLAIIAPGARIVPSPDPRADWVMERRTKTFLVDLRLGNVGMAAALNTFTDMELRQKNYEGVLYLVKDIKQAKEWGRLLGWREWHWFVAESEPVERCLFRVRNQALQPVVVQAKLPGGKPQQTTLFDDRRPNVAP
ncbi:MAG: hypothetical protein ACYC9Q_15105 [Bacillota bacterium]